jgi:hypothetical protein
MDKGFKEAEMHLFVGLRAVAYRQYEAGFGVSNVPQHRTLGLVSLF